MRALGLFLLLVTMLAARGNPFEPAVAETNATQEVLDSGIVILSDEEAAQLRATPDIVSDETNASASSDIVNFQNIRFIFSETQVRIETKDSLKKHFVIHKPTRIILDFAGNADFPTRKRELAMAPFREIRMGVHKGYYRTVIELDGPAHYRIEPFKYGYILTLN